MSNKNIPEQQPQQEQSSQIKLQYYKESSTINEPKTKSINYNFQNMKFFIYSCIIGLEGRDQYESRQDQYCTQKGKEYIHMIYHSSYIMLIINTLFLAYAYIRLRFVRFSFFLNYAINIIYNIIILILSINLAFTEPNECIPVILVQKSIIFLTIKKEIEITMVLKMPLDMAARQANLSSNFLFPYLLLSSGNLDECSKKSSQRIRFLVLFGHTLVSIFGTTMNFLLHFLQSKYQMKLRGGFKFTIIICSVCMIFIYFMIVEYDGAKTIISNKLQCLPLLYTLGIYPKINVLSIISMIMLYFFEDEDLIHRIKNYILNAYEQLTQNNAQGLDQNNNIFQIQNTQQSDDQDINHNKNQQYYQSDLINEQQDEYKILSQQLQMQIDSPEKFYIPKGIVSAKDHIPYLKTFNTEIIGTMSLDQDHHFINNNNYNQYNNNNNKFILQNNYGTLFDSPQKKSHRNNN